MGAILARRRELLVEDGSVMAGWWQAEADYVLIAGTAGSRKTGEACQLRTASCGLPAVDCEAVEQSARQRRACQQTVMEEDSRRVRGYGSGNEKEHERRWWVQKSRE
jgi:hypothetical protein